MRTALFLSCLILLAGCHTTSQETCFKEGFKEGTPEFRDCVEKQRAIGAKRMNKQAGSGGLRGREP